MDKDIIYNTVRQEILEQKKCQFQMLGLALTFSAGIFAFIGTKDVSSFFFMAPVVMNVLALSIILDKATSIQRMVGYLQLMENAKETTVFKWEYHLDIFRGLKGFAAGTENWRKHKYITHISLMLLALSMAAAILFVIKSEVYTKYDTLGITALVFIIFLLSFGIYTFLKRWHQLVKGEYTSKSVRLRWEEAMKH
jgi:hypothetical protein